MASSVPPRAGPLAVAFLFDDVEPESPRPTDGGLRFPFNSFCLVLVPKRSQRRGVAGALLSALWSRRRRCNSPADAPTPEILSFGSGLFELACCKTLGIPRKRKQQGIYEAGQGTCRLRSA